MGDSLLESEVYPMTTANELYNLVCKSSTEDVLKKDPTPVKVSQSVLVSAFKFLAKYNKSQGILNGEKLTERSGNGKSRSCLTVYSSPYNKSRKTQVSSELPSYVKKMMENDASLRRLLKTGSVTISHIPNPGRNSCDTESYLSTNGVRSADRTNCRSSTLLKMFAKKASNSNQGMKEVAETTVDVKSAMASLGVQYESSLSKKRKLVELSEEGNLSTDSDTEGTGDEECKDSKESDFDPTKFLEVSFREEESDEHRRKYKCPHCVKKFCWSTDLKRHILTHTGERPFRCDYCPANFTRKFLMQKHTRKHHQEQISNPPTFSLSNGHSKLDVKLEVEDELEEHIEADSQESESEQFYVPAKETPKPIVINVFSSMRENSTNGDVNVDKEKKNSIALHAAQAISKKINPSLLAKIGKASVDRCPSNADRKLVTLVNS